jgi:protein-L-isoaspartate(D-aspartate) O-methyltransferase
MKESTKHQGLRRHLIETLKAKGIQSEAVLSVMLDVPRHFFMDPSLVGYAYEDNAYPISADQTISQPYTVAFQSQTLAIQPNDKVLEIGTGSGYQTAVLLELKAAVFSIERQQELFKKTSLFLPKLGYMPKKFVFGDGYKGLPAQAPFDKIIVTAGAPFVPKPLLSQLKVGGMLLIPVGDTTQIMTLFVRKSVKEFEKQELGDFAFVPMLEEKN